MQLCGTSLPNPAHAIVHLMSKHLCFSTDLEFMTGM